MRVTIVHRGKPSTHKIGWQLALGGDPTSDRGIRAEGRGPWTGTLELGPTAWQLRAAGLPWTRNGEQVTGVTHVEPGDVIAIGDDRILIEYTVLPLPETAPLDDIERALLGRVGAERSDDHLARVLADHWQEGADEARGAMVQLQREGLDAAELLAAHGARWRNAAVLAGFGADQLYFAGGFSRGALVVGRDEPLADCADAWRLSPRQYVPVRALPRTRRRLLTEVVARTTLGEAGRYVLKAPSVIDQDDPPIDHDHAILSRLDHPHVMQLFDIALTRNAFALVLPWAGIALDELLAKPRPPDEPLARAIGVQLCDALIALRAAGVVHRAIDPSHVLVGDDGHVTLGGFGSATAPDAKPRSTALRSTRLHSTVFRYMSPEQVRGLNLEFPSDLFSLAMLLDSLALGHHPLRNATSDFDTLLAIRDVNLEIPFGTPLADILRRTIVRDPAARPSLEEFRAELARHDPGRAPIRALLAS